EHRKVDDPEQPPASLDQSEVLADFDSQCAQGVIYNLGCVGAEEDEIAGLCARAFQDALDRCYAQEFQNRRLQTLATFRVIVDLDVCEALRTIARDERGV